MIHIDSNNLYYGSIHVSTSYPIKEAHQIGNAVLVLIDPSSYLNDSSYPKERRRGVNALRNLLLFSDQGKLIWEAEFPEHVDYYYRIISTSPIVVYSFSSYQCMIDINSGKIMEMEFMK